MTKEKAIQKYESFIRFILRKSTRYTKKNLDKADLLKRIICKSGGNIQDVSKAYSSAKEAIILERKDREIRAERVKKLKQNINEKMKIFVKGEIENGG